LYKIEDYSKFTNNACTCDQILIFEKNVLRILKWRIQFPTLAVWSNFITNEWDKFSVQFLALYSNRMKFKFKEKFDLTKLRENSYRSYYLCRQFYKIIDVISLDYKSLEYSSRQIVASVLYILLGSNLEYFSNSLILNEFTRNPNAFQKFSEWNFIFNGFTTRILNFKLEEIKELISYTSMFFNLILDSPGRYDVNYHNQNFHRIVIYL
jgi:hypothetical protein